MIWPRRHRGQATVEFAFIAVLFFVVLFGVIEVARLTYGVVAVGNAAREGARWAIASANRPGTPPNTTTACVFVAGGGLENAAKAQVQGITANPTITAVEDPSTPPNYCEVTVTWQYAPMTGDLTHLPKITIKTTSRQYYN
jgi:Flp pilus assembly protein TadG